MIRRKILLPAFAIFSTAAMSQSSSYLIEAEAFQFKGKWAVEKSSECLGSAMLRVFQDNNFNETADALTVIDIKDEGPYHIWTRSRDFADNSRPRSFTLSIDGNELNISGTHGHDGFYWERIGSLDLPAKPTLLRLHDSGGYFGRCDAILLTTDGTLDPNDLSNTQIARWRKSPVAMDYTTLNAPAISPAKDITSGYKTIASASNDNIRISFVKLTDGSIVCKTDYYAAGSWRRFKSAAEDNRIALLANERPVNVNYNQFYPAWDNCTAQRQLSLDGRNYPVNIDGDNSNPYFSGTLTEARATAVTKTATNTIKVTYSCGDKGVITGYWTVPAEVKHVNVRLEFKAINDGAYSMLLHTAKGVPDREASRVMLPPMFNGKAIPASPQMLFSSMMTQCLAMLESQTAYGTVTTFACADLENFPKDWGSNAYSPIGFSLRNSNHEVQAVAVSPLQGMQDAVTKAGGTIIATYIIGINDADCTSTLEYISENVFQVRDYRKQDSKSLNLTLQNVIDLIKNSDHSGWNPIMKGFWDIEANGAQKPTVVQSAPLAMLGAAVACDDEDFYQSRALPSIEYALSRGGYRHVGNEPQTLNPLTSQFPTSLYEGINTLTGGLNPWLKDLALPEGEIRSPNGYFTSALPFRQALSAYRLTGDESWLTRAVSLANKYLSDSFNTDENQPSPGTFYNSRMYAGWQELLDLYELTADSRYLDAATQGASNTIAGIKTWPKVADGMQTVNQGNNYDGVTTIWWKGSERYRLGFPRKAGDAPEHDVEAWKVSPVGLGIEQAATYFNRTSGKNVLPVYMSSWAPRLMQLSSLTGCQTYETYARNAVIGRADNYPGYYATGYTDINLSENFPYTGPDISSIYYHHLPAYLGMLQDYLVTEFIGRSNGLIDFPSARQEGFVWFSNNIYGGQQGSILDREATLWMPDRAINIDRASVNMLSARNSNTLFIMLTCEDDEAEQTTVTISPEISRLITSSNAALFDCKGNESVIEICDGKFSVNVPSRKLTIIVIDMDFSSLKAAPPLTDGMSVIETETAAGKVYLYRIRSPFGWDSIYGFASCSAVSGLTVEVECNGQNQSASTWPYEWSFARFGYDTPVNLKISIHQNGSLIKSISETFENSQSDLPGTSLSHPAYNDAIYRIDGIKVKDMTEPGIYIRNGKKILTR